MSFYHFLDFYFMFIWGRLFLEKLDYYWGIQEECENED